MKSALPLLALLSVTVAMSAQNAKPTLSKTPLTAEEIEIYGAYLDSYHPEVGGKTNLSDKTYPLNVNGLGADTCTQDLHLSASESALNTIHHLPLELVKDLPLQLVDAKKHKIKDPDDGIRSGQSVKSAVTAGFEGGLLRLSEIGFDSSHSLAVFQFSFHCGRLCGYGGTVAFEKKGDKWVRAGRACSIWQS